MKYKKPNIIMITTDQQRFDTVGAKAPSFLRTPHYDWLSREGIEFTSAYSDCPLCVPSRVSIMAGKQTFTHGMNLNGETSSVMGRDETLPTILNNSGYQTAAIGKMHFGPQRSRHGFQEMIIPEDYYREMEKSGSDVKPMRHGLGQNEIYPTMATVPESRTLTSWISEKSVEYIRERRDPNLPFFLWTSFSKPHPPFDPPEPYYSMYRDSNIPEPINSNWSRSEKRPQSFKRYSLMQSYDQISSEIVREARAAYYGLVTQVDYNMGRIFAALQDLDILENTIIIFTSDHGENLGDHGTFGKGFFNESSAHVPFVLRLPKSIKNRCEGENITSPISHCDILPTLVNIAEGDVPDSVDGQDLIAVARGELEPRQYLEGMMGNSTEWLESPYQGDYLSITDGEWKYIWYPEGGDEQLFNLNYDPNELNNLAYEEDYIKKAKELYNILLKRHKNRDSKFVNDDSLIEYPIQKNIDDYRNHSWPGFHTEYYKVDVRH